MAPKLLALSVLVFTLGSVTSALANPLGFASTNANGEEVGTFEVPTSPIVKRTSVSPTRTPVVRRPWSVELRADAVAKSCPLDGGDCDGGFGWNTALSLRYQASPHLSLGVGLEHMRLQETLRLQDERLISTQRAYTLLARSQLQALPRGVWDPFVRLSFGIARYVTDGTYSLLNETVDQQGAWTSADHRAATWVPAYRIGLGLDRQLGQHFRIGALIQWHQWLSGPGNGCANVVGGVCSRPHAGIFDANNAVWLAGIRLGGSFGTPL